MRGYLSVTDYYLEPCKNCLVNSCCHYICQEAVDYIMEKYNLEYSTGIFPVPMNNARLHIKLLKSGIVNDVSHRRISEYEKEN